MFGWLIEIRNFFLALTLAWVGVSLTEKSPDASEHTVKFKPTAEAAANRECPSSRPH